MKSDFRFSNLLGTVYRQGNLLFSSDGTKLLSPVGNRVSCFDLINNKSFTFEYEHRKNIVRIALNKQQTLLLSVDEDGRAILVNFVSRTVLHHFNFKGKVQDLQFSPDGHYFAIATTKFIQVWKTPNMTEDRQFSPFIRHRIYSGHYNDVLSINWSNDSRFFITTSKDMTSKIFSLQSEEKNVAMTLAGHRDYVIKAFFNETQEIIYTISKDGALFTWEYTEKPSTEEDDDEDEDSDSDDDDENKPTKPMSWRITAKNFFHSDAKVRSATFHAKTNLLVVGFTNGEFRLYELPEFNMIQQLSMGQNSIDTCEINSTGEWLAFGSSKLGQLLVYEWASETYILKQQGHFDSINSLVYSPDGSRIVTASDDGKIKIWDINSGFCLYTFQEHNSSITDIKFSKKGNVLFSCSLDGTIRAWDLIRYRNFKTFTATNRIQFNCIAIDPSGEILVAGSQDSFEIFIWSIQTGQLLDSLNGHEGPISCLDFGVENSSVLVSSSWDKTIRIWNIFGRSATVEPIELKSDALSLTIRPDCKEVAVSTLDGYITVFDVESGNQIHLIDGKRDILSGRYLEDRFTSKNSTRSKYFNTISYSNDGLTLIGGGNNNSICMYDISNEVLLKRFTVSQNLQLNGTQEFLNSNRMIDGGEGGTLDLIDEAGEASDLEDRLDSTIPGSKRGDPSLRNIRPEIRVSSIQFSPTSTTSFAAGSTEGLLIYSIDNYILFDPFDLDVDVNNESILESLQEKEYLVALIMAFRLNETYLIERVYESIPYNDIKLIVNDLPIIYVSKLLNFISDVINSDNVGSKKSNNSGDQHFEFNLLWVKIILEIHGQFINLNKFEFQSSLKKIQRFLSKIGKDIILLNKRNNYLLEYLTVARDLKGEEEGDDEEGIIEDVEEDDDEEMEVDGEEDVEADEELGGWFGSQVKSSNGIVFSVSDEEDEDEDEDDEKVVFEEDDDEEEEEDDDHDDDEDEDN